MFQKQSSVSSSADSGNFFIFLLFFMSGFPALVYQIIWQRSLFTIYGVNIESITVVVATFMLGLGIGSLAGGYISKDRRFPPLLVFGLAELIIGVFGVASLKIFDWVGSFTLGSSSARTGIFTFLLVFLPTLMMGMTLPLLLAYVVRRSGNVGRSTGTLYFFNTMGSAFASLCAALFLMKMFGKQGSINLAAAINMIVSTGAIVLYLKQRNEYNRDASYTEGERNVQSSKPAIAFPLALVFSFLSGYIALSYEIVWIRVYSFAMASSAATFSLVLSMYLAGIALGSSEARKFCHDVISENSPVHVRALSGFVILANIFGFLLIPLSARAFQHSYPALALLMIIPAAACLGATFPLVSHMAIPPDSNSGARLSYIYLANIIGSALGCYLTGFFMMDHWPLSAIALFLALAGLLMGAIFMIPARLKKSSLMTALGGAGVLVMFFFTVSPALYRNLYELLLNRVWGDNINFAHVIENKSGIVTVGSDGTIFGDGVYDGCFNTDITEDKNLVVRAYSISAFHPSPREVLLIGLSSGSWAQVIAHNPAVEHLTIVEINPGYLKVIPEYPAVSSLLNNPKVEIVIDDGRRWLSKNRDRRFDFIVMNTSFSWRAMATNLLSVEFLDHVKAHLKDNGIFMYNATNSPEADRTGAAYFPFAYKFINAIVASSSPIQINTARMAVTLKGYEIDGKKVIDLSKEKDRKRLDEILSIFRNIDADGPWFSQMESRKHILARTNGLRLITDDNMVTEWAQRGFY